jgi:DNA-binding YbaB/EbfC family protein
VFDFLKNIGQMGSMLRNLPKIQEEMAKMRERVGQITAEGDAGAGMVKVKFNGRMELLNLTISEEAWKLNDREMLETMLKAAVNQGITKVQQAVANETTAMASNLGLPGGLPPGLNLPGMG